MRKFCKACNTKKSFSKFSISRRAKDGRQAWCKECQAEWGHEYRAPILRGRKGPKNPWYSKKIRDVMRNEFRKAIRGIAA